MTIIEIARYLVAKGLAAAFLVTPSAPVITPQGTPGATNYGYVIVARNELGCTVGSALGSTTTGAASLTGVNFNAVAWTVIAGATSYDVYRTVGGATQGKIGNTTDVTFNDTGLAGDSSSAPVTNTAATDIGIGVIPKSPDRCYAVLAYGAARPSDGQFGTDLIFREYPVIRIVRRGAIGDTVDAMTGANAAYIAVGRIGVDTLDGVLYENASVFPPAPSGTPDGSNRPMWEFRVSLSKAPSLS